MSGFKNNKFFKFISSILGQSKEENAGHSELNRSEFASCDLEEDIFSPERIWKRDNEPLRQLMLWGYDENNNPGYLVLYGTHKFKSKKTTEGNVLEAEVKYTSYALFKGKEGHLPSFQAVKIIEPYDYKTRSYGLPKMYFKKGGTNSWYWRENTEYLVKGFKNLPQEHHICIPYFVVQSYEQHVQKVMNRPRSFEGFRLVSNPNEVLKLEGEQLDYLGIVIDIMSHPNIYIRKKKLNELISMSPPKEVYLKLLEVGSTEVISGLFLELAKLENSILIEVAKSLQETEIKWAEENYAKGLKRCVKIYVNALDKDLRAERIKWIHKNLSKMDLHLTRINGKDIPKDRILEGSAYRKYAASGLLQDYFYNYDYKTRKSTRSEASKRYEEGQYSDGVRLKVVHFKDTLQEAEAYGLSDVLGKIAYYLDAPRITYYLKGSGKGKALKYFRRYIKRVINSYAETNQDKFVEAMKYMLTSYAKQDYVCKFRGNFQFNELLKYYLYQDFKEKPPVGWNYWSERNEWMTNDQLMRITGRYEFAKEVWDNHLEVVADIALTAQIDQVVKACYYILKDSPKCNEFIDAMSYRKLINLSLASYEPLADMFRGILESKLAQSETFDSELMIALIGSADKRMYGIALDYFKRTNGVLSASDIADLIFLENLEQWGELFRENLLFLDGEQYIEFIRQIISKAGKFLELKKELPKSIRDILSASTNKMGMVAEGDKLKFINELIPEVLQGVKLPDWLGSFIEEVIFSISYEELDSVVSDIIIEPLKGWTHSRNKAITAVLEAIKNKSIPEDGQIMDILSSGTSKIIKMLFNIINENSEELKNRFSTLLIMLEAEAYVLNEKAKEIFNSLEEEKQRKLHALFIDSPVAKTYYFGLEKLEELYGDNLPEEFILQMLEHSSAEVKAYISGKTDRILNNLGGGNEKLFMYYVKTLLLLPNRVSKSKAKVYDALPKFALKYRSNLDDIQSLLMDIGGSNSIADSERALVALAKIRGEVVFLES